MRRDRPSQWTARACLAVFLGTGVGCSAVLHGGRSGADPSRNGLFPAGVVESPPSSQAAAPAGGSAEGEELAKKLSNPVAALISVPIQFNYDRRIGPSNDGERRQVNVQPVIPISLTEDWNLISRTIAPVIWQDDVIPDKDQFGLGDITQSAFFSPVKPTERGWIWGAGPVFFLPTGTDEFLTAKKWGTGPTGVALRQVGPWTYGALANHIWSFAGESDRSDINSTFLQPFLAHTTKTATTIGLNTESTYNWEEREWSVPINATVAQIVKLGKLPVQFQVGARYWAHSPDDGPDGWGARFAIIFMFPK